MKLGGSIAYLSLSYVPSRSADSVHVMKMSSAFVNSGAKVVLFARRGGESILQDVFSFYGVPKKFELVIFSWPPFFENSLTPSLEGVVKFWWRRFDLVYGRNLLGCYFASLLGIPVIYETHELASTLRRSKSFILRRLARSAALKRIVVISKPLLRDLEETLDLSDGLVVIAPGAADDPGEPQPAASTPSSPLRVGYVGHLYPGRGMEIIEALSRTCPFADFHVVGGSEKDVRYWIGRTREFENLTIHGFIPPSETTAFRASFDVLVAPYQNKVTIEGKNDTSKWMSPMKLFEYMSAGRPILCSDLPVLREVMEDERNCLMCEPGNLESWREALERLHGDVDLRGRLGREAYDDFRRHYTWKARAEGVLHFRGC